MFMNLRRVQVLQAVRIRDAVASTAAAEGARQGCMPGLLARAALAVAPQAAPFLFSHCSDALHRAATRRVKDLQDHCKRAELCASRAPALQRTGSALITFDCTAAARTMVHEFQARIRANFFTRYFNEALVIAGNIFCSALRPQACWLVFPPCPDQGSTRRVRDGHRRAGCVERTVLAFCALQFGNAVPMDTLPGPAPEFVWLRVRKRMSSAACAATQFRRFHCSSVA
jgi:hypothetical protein